MTQPALDEPRLRRLIDAGRGLLVAKVDVDAVLQQLLDVARDVTGARYAAVGVLERRGRSSSASSRPGSTRPPIAGSGTCRAGAGSSGC